MSRSNTFCSVLAVLFVSLAVAACGDDGGNQSSDAGTIDAGTIDAVAPDAEWGTTVDQAVNFLGGGTALDALTRFQLTVTGTRSMANESQTAGDPAVQTSTFSATVSIDITNTAQRIDYTRNITYLGGIPLTYSEIYDVTLGYISGQDSVFGGGDTEMLSSRLASGREQQTLLNPHLILQRIRAIPSLATDAGEVTDGGTTFRVVDFDDEIAPIRLWVDPSDGRIDRATTMVNDLLLRDVALTISYADWAEVDGIKFPNTVTITQGSDVIHSETRTAVEVNPTFGASTFQFPGGASPVFDADLAHFGDQSHQFFQAFAGLGIPLDAPQTTVLSTELAPGIFHLTGGTHHSLAVEQANGLVIVEAPHSPARAEAIIAWAGTNFPGKSITHVVATHHHQDHSAGLRAFVAVGATVVIHTLSRAFFNDQVFAAPSTIVPDGLSQNPATATFSTVAAGAPVTLADATNPIDVHALTTTHAGDMVLVHVQTSGDNFVFQSDLYNPGGGGSTFNPAFAQELLDGIQAISVDILVGGHGGVAPLSELVDFLAP